MGADRGKIFPGWKAAGTRGVGVASVWPEGQPGRGQCGPWAWGSSQVLLVLAPPSTMGDLGKLYHSQVLARWGVRHLPCSGTVLCEGDAQERGHTERAGVCRGWAGLRLLCFVNTWQVGLCCPAGGQLLLSLSLLAFLVSWAGLMWGRSCCILPAGLLILLSLYFLAVWSPL